MMHLELVDYGVLLTNALTNKGSLCKDDLITDTMYTLPQTTAMSDIFSRGVPGLKEFNPAQVCVGGGGGRC